MLELSTHLVGATTLVERLLWRAQHQSERHAYTFLHQGSSSLSYAQLDRQARAIAALLQRQDLQGEPILLLLQPGLDYIASFFGCLYAGAIAVPAYPPFSPRMLPRIQSIMHDTKARVVFTTSDTLMDMKRSQIDPSKLEGINWIAIDTIDDQLADEWEEPDIDSNTIAFLQYTSGSTASPRGVMVSHNNLIHNLELLRTHCGQSPESHLVSWVPPFHDLGLIAGILLPFYVGFPATLMSPVAFLQRPLRWLQAISDTRATMSVAPNFAYELCVQKTRPEQRTALDLSRWEIAGNGGEILRPATLERFSTAFAPCGFHREAFFPGYGMAESTLIMATGTKGKPTVVRTFQQSALEQHQAVPVSAYHQEAHALVGYERLALDHKILIVSPETLAECPTNKVGEIWLRGPIVASGYWKKPEETIQTFQGYLRDTEDGPFLRTGDLGFIDEGQLFITGRLKDLIIIRGQNYYPQDIEYTTDECHPAVRPGCSAAFSVEVNGCEQLVILAEIDPRYEAEQPDESQIIIDTIRRAVSAQQELSVYEVVLLKAGSIHKTSSGKIQRRACRAAFLQNDLILWGK